VPSGVLGESRVEEGFSLWVSGGGVGAEFCLGWVVPGVSGVSAESLEVSAEFWRMRAKFWCSCAGILEGGC
jgi:hypothetical protein